MEPPRRVEYVLWPQEDFTELSDEFAIRGCHIWLRGGHLAVEAVSETADLAAVAKEYAAALGNRLGYQRLLTVQEFGALPSRAITTVALSAQDRRYRQARLREARQDIVAPAHPRLSQCYDYFQSALEDQEHALSHLYKMVESIEEDYGGEGKARSALGVEPLKSLKRLANDRSPNSRDQRHAPVSPGTGTALTDAERARALNDGRALLRKFEERLGQTGDACRPGDVN